eukprot:883582-Amphidinium_carterae.1
MWAHALELCVQRLTAEAGSDLMGRVAAISGSGQQHGTVYWSHAGLSTLQQLRTEAEKKIVHTSTVQDTTVLE